ncbi:MAG: hypothetical protein AAFP85_19160 [Pseudomonadota bacterium]
MRALSEIGNIVQKAALGAGIPLGQAEDLGRVAAYIAGMGGDLRVISDALASPAQPHVTWGNESIVVKAGSGALIAPIIRDAFVMGVKRAELADRGHADLVKAVLSLAGYEVTVAGNMIMHCGKTPPLPAKGPVDVPVEIWNAWSLLAASTYVLESDTSRNAGAGAGLTDND